MKGRSNNQFGYIVFCVLAVLIALSIRLTAQDGRNANLPVVPIKMEANLLQRDTLNAELIAAIKSRNRVAVRSLLDAGADPNAHTPARTLAADQGKNYSVPVVGLPGMGLTHVEMKDIALSPEQTALHLATGLGEYAIVKALLNKGANPNARDGEGATALHLAARAHEEQVAIVKALLDKGANPDMSDGEGGTALMDAAGYGHLATIKLLLSKGANPDSKDRDGATALRYILANRYFAEELRIAVAQNLLSRGADVNARDNAHTTALMDAADAGSLQIVRLLLRHRADVNAKDLHGNTALKIAKHDGYSQIVRLLKRARAKE